MKITTRVHTGSGSAGAMARAAWRWAVVVSRVAAMGVLGAGVLPILIGLSIELLIMPLRLPLLPIGLPSLDVSLQSLHGL